MHLQARDAKPSAERDTAVRPNEDPELYHLVLGYEHAQSVLPSADPQHQATLLAISYRRVELQRIHPALTTSRLAGADRSLPEVARLPLMFTSTSGYDQPVDAPQREADCTDADGRRKWHHELVTPRAHSLDKPPSRRHSTVRVVPVYRVAALQQSWQESHRNTIRCGWHCALRHRGLRRASAPRALCWRGEGKKRVTA